MKNTILIAVAIGTVLALTVGAVAMDNTETRFSAVERAYPPVRDLESARLETLWIFEADFSDLVGDNAGWTAFDRSGTIGQTNYWHHDTIRISDHPTMGDSTWWCGTYNECWRQERGYGNEWIMILERYFDEHVGGGGTPTLEYDQRYAMEKDYDYGYVEYSIDGGATWVELDVITNFGFAGTPGRGVDWDDPAPQANPEGGGHVTFTVPSVAFDLRFRFESDIAYSSQDQFNNPPLNSCLDGAWQIDNITLHDGAGTTFFEDDCESGNNGWVHDDLLASGQTGVTFFRGQFGIDFITGRSFTCDDRVVGSWMYAAVDPFTSQMVDDQNSWLVSPPIDVSGAAKLVGHWDMWVDLPRPTEDIFDLSLASNDLFQCVTDPAGFVDESPGAWYGGPFWGNWVDDWDAFAGNDWLAIRWELYNTDPPAEPHKAGIFLNRQRVGIPSGDAGTTWNYSVWSRLHDWYQEQLADAQADTNGVINVKDDDDIVSVTLYADNGITQNSYACTRINPEGNDWRIQSPSTEIVAGVEIRYYFEAEDGVGNTALWPPGAPDVAYEFSILPINATVSNPGILLVDKHGRLTPSAARDYLHSSEYFYREMLGVLGYEWDKYDVEVPSGSTDQSNGPDSAAYKYYDTQIWFTNEFDAYTIKAPDQANLISWLNQAETLGKERNLIISGNDWGKELEEVGKETLGFYETWLASDYISNSIGVVTTDSVPGIQNKAGGTTFMDHDDGAAILRGACPQLHYYDVVNHDPNFPGAETVLDYKRLDTATFGAGVAYTHPTIGYQAVNLGFGMEFIADGTVDGGASNYTPEGYYKIGLEDRVNLMGNIMEDYFGVVPGGSGTGVEDVVGGNKLSYAYPNPFNPVTKIAYSVKNAGPVTIEVYNVAGKVVRTLLDTEVDAGASGYVVWDGANDMGEKCASGVYFYRINAPGFVKSNKMIMLK